MAAATEVSSAGGCRVGRAGVDAYSTELVAQVLAHKSLPVTFRSQVQVAPALTISMPPVMIFKEHAMADAVAGPSVGRVVGSRHR